jgi:alanine racemase
VKSDGYGHGIEVAARLFLAGGADMLAVATLDEGLLLRRAGIGAPVLVLFAIPPADVVTAAEAGLELFAGDAETLRGMLGVWRDARRNGGAPDARPAGGAPDARREGGERAERALRIHLEIETGLERAGITPEAAADAARTIEEAPRVELAGICSHLAMPHDPQISAAQLDRFGAAITSLERAKIPIPPRHIAATGGLFASNAPPFELVRVGLSLYGLLPDGFPVASGTADRVAHDLRPALALKARPLRVEQVSTGTSVGYGGVWRAERPSVIATLPIGYGDGWVRAYGGSATALVRGRRVPLIGAVAMDAVAADVTDVPGAGLGDEFVLIGEQAGERITAGQLARLRNTISWEIVAAMSARLARVYHAAAGLTGLRTLLGETLAEVEP